MVLFNSESKLDLSLQLVNMYLKSLSFSFKIYLFLFENICLFILVVPGLGCGMQDLQRGSSVVACGIVP